MGDAVSLTSFFIAAVVFVAVFVQGVLGFGLALISMPLLVGLVGIRIAAPLVALVGIASQVAMLLYYRQALEITAIKSLAIGSVLGIPLGVLALSQVAEGVVTALLGVVVLAYGVYGLAGLRLPKLRQASWGYGLGFAGGVLTGAYNTGGPPLILYGNACEWPPAQFKGNMQALFLLHSVTVLITHAIAKNFSPAVFDGFLVTIPAIIAGLVGGLRMARLLKSETFRKLVLVGLIVLGIGLLV